MTLHAEVTPASPKLAKVEGLPIVSSTLPAIARSAPFGVFVAALALRSAFEHSELFDGRWLYGLQVIGAAGALLLLRRDYKELLETSTSAASWVLAAGAGIAVFWIWIHSTAPWMSLGAPTASFEPVGAAGALDWNLIALRLFGAVLVVPLIEELFWRSFLLRWIDQRDFLALPPGQSSLRALVVSSAIFALAHPLWFAGLVAGLIYGTLYQVTGRLWFPIAAHALTNLMLGLWIINTRAWSYW
jgi:hypothetical protein